MAARIKDVGLLFTILFQVMSQALTITTCSNPPPGIRKMVRGVDITTLDLVPLEMVGSNGFESPVLSFSCDNGEVWKSPEGVEYQLPDQVWHMTTLPGGWLSSDVNLYTTHEDVRKSLIRHVGGEGSIWKFAFSASTSYKRMENTITNTSRYILDTSSFDSATRVDLIPNWALTLDRFAQMFLDRMITGDFTSNPDAYKRFIDQFGTHYFATGKFGGYIRVLTETNTRYFLSSTETEAKTNAQASFLKIFSAQGGRVSGSTTVDGRFSQESTQTIRYYGGDTNLLTKDGITKWQPTVDADPWLFSGELKPISDLITDETKKSSMTKAVANHVMQSYLSELERLISMGRLKFKDTVLITLQNRIKAMKSKTVLVEEEVESLGRDVEEQLIVPAWFTTRTELCYKWKADGDPLECGKATGEYCVKPNTMTPFYRDDTYSRPGGCLMQWGIKSSGYPSWFSQVRVCYRWYPDGNPLNCGGGGPGSTYCASMNEYTTKYRDDTYSRPGGCQMSWKLEVPSTAPLWLRSTKMCFSWYPDGSAISQCGVSSSSRNLCAVANQWTEYYRDDTTSRDGGCQMSWGLKLDV